MHVAQGLLGIDQFAREEGRRPQGRLRAPEGEAMGDEGGQVRVGIGRPVHPTRRVVLGVGVVVAPLRAGSLVAHQQHRHALREQHRGEHVALLAGADFKIAGSSVSPSMP